MPLTCLFCYLQLTMILPLIILFIQTNGLNNRKYFKKDEPVICVNEIVINESVKGRFFCPEPGQSTDLYHCCGIIGEQFCCNPHDTPGFKWGLGVAVAVGVLVLLAVGYSIQVFRACDNCYHECPICSVGEDETEFQWDTRWYSVSHEGNRYGVTFHSHKFAKTFMQLLEDRYGPWNTANILRIRKENQDFVVLNIFFHDLFTPWFYTQGPIKNDEEWIKTDFNLMCKTAKDNIAVHPCYCCYSSSSLMLIRTVLSGAGRGSGNNNNNKSQSATAMEQQEEQKQQEEQQHKKLTNQWQQRRLLKPWTKTTYKQHSNTNNLTAALTCSTSAVSKENSASVIVLDDIIEVYGNSKAIQTRREIRVKTF